MKERESIHKRASEIAGVCCLAFAVFLLLALFSYHPLDPSFTHYAPDDQLRNLTGTVGSYTADTLIKLTGIGIFWLPVMLLLAALGYLREPRFRVEAPTVAGLAGLVFATSGIAALLIDRIEIYGISLRAGGLLGEGVMNLFDAYLRLAGSLIVFFVIMLISLMILFDFSVMTLAGRSTVLTGMILKGIKALIGGCLARFKKRQPVVSESEKASAGPGPLIAEPVRPESLKEKLQKAEQTHFEFGSRASAKC